MDVKVDSSQWQLHLLEIKQILKGKKVTLADLCLFGVSDVYELSMKTIG